MSLSQRTIARDIFPSISPFVKDSGICPTTEEGITEMLRYLDVACFNLHKRLDSEGTLWETFVPVDGGCFACPQEIREIRQITLNGIPMRQRSEFYLGRIVSGTAEGCCAPFECRDLGDYYLPQWLPKQRGIRIGLIALDNGDAGKEVVLETVDEYGTPRRETLTLLENQQAAITDTVVYDVRFLKKPKTLDVVRLVLCYDDGQQLIWANYLPNTEEGLFRRKQLPQRFWGCNIARIVGKMRYIRITDADQVIPYNDPVALGFAVAATSAFFRRDHDDYGAKMLMALQELKVQMQDADSASNHRQMVVRTYSGGVSLANNVKRWA